MGHLMPLSIAQATRRRMVGWCINSELKRTWKEGVFINLAFLSGTYFECLKKGTKILIEDSGCPGEIQTSYLPNINQKRGR